ncbi:MAG: hypothetical protein JXA57_17450 [Armatimonadetes bacterium]|nr:hypothetical protein [Armatimonadota bacterium]
MPKAAGDQSEDAGDLLLAHRGLNDSDLVVGEAVEPIDTLVGVALVPWTVGGFRV